MDTSRHGGHGGVPPEFERIGPLRSILALVAALLLSACNENGGSLMPTPPASTWVFQFSPNMPKTPTPNGSGGVFFDFPSVDGVHYLVRGHSSPLSGTMSMQIEVISTGNPTFVSGDPKSTACPTPAAATLYFQRVGDRGTAKYKFYRWFASERYEIKPGIGTYSVPLTVDRWGSVFAEQDAGQFAAALASPMAIGATFGKGCFAGHGIYVTGGAVRMYIRSFTVQ
jgi:hypothetical protein